MRRVAEGARREEAGKDGEDEHGPGDCRTLRREFLGTPWCGVGRARRCEAGSYNKSPRRIRSAERRWRRWVTSRCVISVDPLQRIFLSRECEWGFAHGPVLVLACVWVPYACTCLCGAFERALSRTEPPACCPKAVLSNLRLDLAHVLIITRKHIFTFPPLDRNTSLPTLPPIP